MLWSEAVRTLLQGKEYKGQVTLSYALSKTHLSKSTCEYEIKRGKRPQDPGETRLEGEIFVSVMNDYLNVFYSPLSFFADFKFPSEEYAKDIACPVSVYYSRKDKTVRPEHTEKLLVSFTKSVPEAHLLPYFPHNQVFLSDEFRAEICGLSLSE